MLGAVQAAQAEQKEVSSPQRPSASQTSETLKKVVNQAIELLLGEDDPGSRGAMMSAEQKVMRAVNETLDVSEAKHRQKLRQKDYWWKIKLETQRAASKGELQNKEQRLQAAFQVELQEQLKKMLESGDSSMLEAAAKIEQLESTLEAVTTKSHTLESLLATARHETQEVGRQVAKLDKEQKRAQDKVETLTSENEANMQTTATALGELDVVTAVSPGGDGALRVTYSLTYLLTHLLTHLCLARRRRCAKSGG